MLYAPFLNRRALRRAAMFAILPTIIVTPAWSQGPNTSNPAPTPPIPLPVITDQPQLDGSNTTGCQQQYTQELQRLAQSEADTRLQGLSDSVTAFQAQSSALDAQAGAISAQAVGFTTSASQLIIDDAVGAGIALQANIANITAASVAVSQQRTALDNNVSAVQEQIDAIDIEQERLDLEVLVSTRPQCNQTFTGTVLVEDGGVNVTGDSYFQGEIGVVGNLALTGNVTSSTVTATQGISADGGSIFLGDTNLETFSDGITLGGGALSGAGDPNSDEAVTGDVDAIAIGNGANASNANGTALGTGANSVGVGATALGANTSATEVNATALGTGAGATGVGGTALGANSSASTGVAAGLGATTTTGVSIGNGAGQPDDAGVAVGTSSRALESTDTAVGNNSTVNAANGAALGANTVISPLSDNGVAVGENTTIGGASNNVTAVGWNIDIADNINNAVALGAEANVQADGGIAIGQVSDAVAEDSIAIGLGVNTNGVRGVGIGLGADADATDTVAIGSDANAIADQAIAIGTVAVANAAGSIAQGTDAAVVVGATNGIAVGTGAVTTGVNAAAVGPVAFALGTNASAYGAGATAAAANSSALGVNATVAPTHTNSSALGAGAATTTFNQVLIGTTSQTYTTPGITSDLSRTRQVGLTQVVTTDAAGNLASDQGAIFRGLATVQAGVAIATAIETPELASGESFGIRFGWGGFDSFEGNTNAVGLSAIGVVARNVFGQGDRLAVDAGLGLGWSEFQGYSESAVVAGRAGMQLTW